MVGDLRCQLYVGWLVLHSKGMQGACIWLLHFLSAALSVGWCNLVPPVTTHITRNVVCLEWHTSHMCNHCC